MANEYLYHYPGDPICTAEEMTAAEFKAANPNRAVQVFALDDNLEPGELQASYPVDDVICDSCNAECAGDALVTLTLNRLWCPDCARRWLHPFRVTPGPTPAASAPPS